MLYQNKLTCPKLPYMEQICPYEKNRDQAATGAALPGPISAPGPTSYE